MKIESDEEFIELMRQRFASKPYTGMWAGTQVKAQEYWTDERYEEFIQDLLTTQRLIRDAIKHPERNGLESATPDEWDAQRARWMLWSVATYDVGATPTPWHRIWSAVQSVIAATRQDERRRIAIALRDDHAALVGPTARELIEEITRDEVDRDG